VGARLYLTTAPRAPRAPTSHRRVDLNLSRWARWRV